MGSKKILLGGAILLVGFNVWVWSGIISPLGASRGESAIYFLDVGQGDAELITLSTKDSASLISILIDGGRDKRVLQSLDSAFGSQREKYIDIVILTHPDLDHLGGLIDVVKRYAVGLFVSNGIDAEKIEFKILKTELEERKIPTLVLGEGDIIRYGENALLILSPDEKLKKGKNTNEAGIVALLKTPDARALFTADVGFPAENRLLAKGYDLEADVLKVGHHGSKYSSGENFIARVKPLIAGIGVGKNSYGHPTPRVLKTLESSGAHTFTTQEEGTFKIVLNKDFSLPDEESKPPFASAHEDESLVSALGAVFFGGYRDSGILTLSLPRAKKEGRAGLSR